MGEIAKYLRFLINADKEAKISVVHVSQTPAQFTSQLTSEQTRRRIGVYNNSNDASGEWYYGFSAAASPSGESIPIPKKSLEFIPIADTDAIELYFFSDLSESGELRVLEFA